MRFAKASLTSRILTPLQQLWEPFLQMTGGGLGRQTWQNEHAEDDLEAGQLRNAVDKLRPPAILRFSRTFLDNVVCCKRVRLLHILLNLDGNQLEAEGAGSLAGVLPQCPALSVLDLGGNQIEDQGAGRLEGVVPQCRALSELDLGVNHIGDQGAGSFAGVLPQCPVLSKLNLGNQAIRSEMKEQKGLLEYCHSAECCPSWVLEAIRSEIKEQGGLLCFLSSSAKLCNSQHEVNWFPTPYCSESV